MEYDGATTTELAALKHEVFHSWFAGGLKPASQNDAWLDEGWTVYNTAEGISQIRPFDMSKPPIILSSSNPFNRITHNSSTSPDAYKDGFRFFAGLASELGLKELVSYMNKFYEKYKGLPVTTKQLQCHLIEESGNNKIDRYFDRFV
jgi:aminopeptidase N